MNKNIRLLVEGFFDDEIFNVENDIKSDIEDLGRYYYDYQIGDIYYLNKKPYAICCGENKQFKDNKLRFCLLTILSKKLQWSIYERLQIIKDITTIRYSKRCNTFSAIDENGYKNTYIIKNNYNFKEFPAFEYCINLGENVYLPAIDELQIMYLNKDILNDKLSNNIFNNYYWSSTQFSDAYAFKINLKNNYLGAEFKPLGYKVIPFIKIN